ncbi:MAG: nickel/cobalt efflux transporter RcnA [Rhodobacteraceae bacterium]|nr:nickel/cobalt efflux transporter RcnA [Paracoccaceae bacterium]
MNITDAITQGASNPFLLFGMALILGALHGLEPGHSKTMMAAYIVAIKGSVFQAVLLGVSAAASHSVIVWLLALLGLHYGNEMIGEDFEPILMIVSGLIIIIIAAWVYFQARRALRKRHSMAMPNAHRHDTAHVHHDHEHHPHSDHGHSHHTHEHHTHNHEAMDDDAHARAHARQIEKQLGSGETSNLQTILFGLTGGLIPCPSAITVLLLCLHLKKVVLGVTLVAAFSIGLAVTLVSVGVAAAIGLRYAAKKAPWMDKVMANAPFVSAAFICLVGIIMLVTGAAHYDLF